MEMGASLVVPTHWNIRLRCAMKANLPRYDIIVQLLYAESDIAESQGHKLATIQESKNSCTV